MFSSNGANGILVGFIGKLVGVISGGPLCSVVMVGTPLCTGRGVLMGVFTGALVLNSTGATMAIGKGKLWSTRPNCLHTDNDK